MDTNLALSLVGAQAMFALTLLMDGIQATMA
jgi:hypothetical protein